MLRLSRSKAASEFTLNHRSLLYLMQSLKYLFTSTFSCASVASMSLLVSRFYYIRPSIDPDKIDGHVLR
jgi:hypothetical protein